MYRLKKSLGQHFLKDENICKRILSALQEFPFKNLLEVGPGGGALTKYLLELPDIDFRAVELDDEKVNGLLLHYPTLKGKLIHGDILEIPKPFQEPFVVVGNFPYNISSQILFRILEWEPSVEAMVGMFQKEVAQRICSAEGNKDYGILSVLVQAFFKTEYLFDVPENAFNPPPKVMSGVIRLVNRQNPYGITDKARFFRLVKTAFGQRRKQLRNPLRGYFPPETLKEEVFSLRAEALTVQDYVELMDKML